MTGGIVGLIGCLDGRPFLQITGAVAAAALTVNDRPAGPTCWLADGDVIAAGVLRIECRSDEALLRLTVSYADAGYVTLPPQSGTGEATHEAIAPQSPALPPAAARAGTRRWPWALGIALAVLAALAWQVFTARSVGVEVSPATADLRIEGAWLPLRLAGRFLLQPGDYRLRAEAPGYTAAEQPLRVGDAPRQEVQLRLDPLPGRLVIGGAPPVALTVRVDGQPVIAREDGAYPVPAGRRRIEVQAARYRPFTASVDIAGRGTRQDLTVALTPDWADVSVSSEPAGAAIRVDGEALGATPATVPIASGAREIELRLEGYKPWRRRLQLAAGGKLTLPAVRLEETDGLLSVSTTPAGATVTVDGRYRGTAPLDAEIAAGRPHEVIVALPGYETVTRRVEVARRGSATLALELTERLGTVRIEVEPADAEIFIDGVRRGVGAGEYPLRVVEHDIEARKPGFVTWRTRITPRPGLPQRVEARLLTPEQAVVAATPRTVTTGQGLVLRLIAPGEFVMGAPRREQGRRPNETERQVRITRPFYLAIHEVSNRQYREFRANHTSGAEKYRELAGAGHPVVMLGWDDAAAYCNWLSDRDGLPPAYEQRDGAVRLVTPATRGYRLPTEAEWEWAARYNGGGGGRRYPWGEQMPPGEGSGNFADRSARGIVASVLSSYEDGHAVTAPVGSFAASPLGIFDLGGNAAEWVHDFYTVPAAGIAPEVDPTGPASGQYHVIRGSGWRSAGVSELRFAYRDYGDQGRLDVGFRIARYAE